MTHAEAAEFERKNPEYVRFKKYQKDFLNGLPSYHNRRPRSRGGDDTPGNVSRVVKAQYDAWQILFKDETPEMICKLLNEIWIDPAYEVVCIRKIPQHTEGKVISLVHSVQDFG